VAQAKAPLPLRRCRTVLRCDRPFGLAPGAAIQTCPWPNVQCPVNDECAGSQTEWTGRCQFLRRFGGLVGQPDLNSTEHAASLRIGSGQPRRAACCWPQGMSKAGLEAERAALLAEYRLLMEEQKIALGLPDDIAAKQWLLERLKDYEKRYAAFRHKVEHDGSGL
jgi:hypothetical protein